MQLKPTIIKTKSGFHLRFTASNGRLVLWNKKYKRTAPLYEITTYFGWAKREVKIIDKTKTK